jgi:hypothetical protein
MMKGNIKRGDIFMEDLLSHLKGAIRFPC